MTVGSGATGLTGADVTVVMPVMNRAAMIGRALASIDRQSVAPAEVIVVDDASTDATAAIAEQAGARVISLPVNGGSGPARNIGVQAARTDWIAFLDSDDEWLPGHLEGALAAAGDHLLVAAPGITTQGRAIGNPWCRDIEVDALTTIVSGDLICTSGTVVRRDALVRAGLFRPLRRAQDLDMWIRVLELGSGLALGRPGFTYTLHSGQAIHDEELTRWCYGQIVGYCRRQSWFGPRDEDRAWARFRWDGLRTAQRNHQLDHAAYHLRWFAARPHTWTTLLRKLAERRQSRRRSAAY